MRKLLHKFEHSWQAELVQELLAAQEIASYEIKGAREYASVVTGIGQAATEIYVDEASYPQAQHVLTNYLKKSNLHLVDDETANEKPKQKNHFRNIVFLSIGGALLLPIIFNLFATLNYITYTKQNPPSSQKALAAVIVILGWLGSTAMLLWMFTNITDSIWLK